MKGDYVLIPPLSAIVPDEEYLKSLEKDYALLFRTHSRFYLKTNGLKYLLKDLAIRFDWIEISRKKLTRGVDYYFFKRIT
jgi:intein/homing endonuclease